MRRGLTLFAILMAVLTVLSSCSPPPPPAASQVLLSMETALTESGQPLPDGVIRLTAASPDSPDCLTEALFSALYGEAARGLLASEDGQTPPVGDAALFLSLAPYPRARAVFRCSDLRTAATVAGLCQGRVDTLRRGFGGGGGTEIPWQGSVSVEGCYVILVVAEDPRPAVSAAKRAIG